MGTQLVTASVMAGLLGVGGVTTGAAQKVSAHIRIGDGPVSGVIHIGERHRPVGDVVVVDRVRPRVILVERRSGRDFLRRGRGIRVIVAYYDPWSGVFYDRGGRGLHAVRLFNHGGRFYIHDDHDFGRRFPKDRFRHRDRDDHRGDRFDRDRRDDRDRRWRQERRDERRDDRGRRDDDRRRRGRGN
ncbi:MAG: hypothetical protein R2909_09005 [Gemmatimonadales bacterium]